MRFGADYDKALFCQRKLEQTLETQCKAADVARLVLAWQVIVAYKRELRGLPRMKAVDATAMLRNARTTRQPRATPLELETAPAIDEAKESLNGQTVTTPPTP